MKKGLVLEGGAMRGLFTAGVLDVFMENGIDFDGAAGISAGAVFGCNFKSRQIGRSIRYNKRFCGDKRYGSFSNWIKTGDVFDVDFCYDTIPNELDVFDTETFRENPIEFWVGATNVETGEAEYHLCTDGGENDIQWMRASASIPFVSRIVEVDGYKLLDGGTSDGIPYRFMTEKQGYDKCVTVLTRQHGYKKKKNKLMPILRAKLKAYPNLIRALADRHIRYNALYEYMEERVKAGENYIIQPPAALDVAQMEKNPSKLEAVYQLGREEALKHLDKVKEFLGIS